MWTITVHGDPKPKGSLRHIGRGRLVEQVKGSTEWKQAVAAAVPLQFSGPTLTGPVELWATVVVPRPKSAPNRRYPITRSSGDGDKHLRNLLDGIVSGGLLADDSQVITAHVTKQYPTGPHAKTGAHITVKELPDE